MFLKIGVTLLAINVVTISLFLISVPYAYSVISWQTISQVILLLAELILFDFVILGLIYANQLSIVLMLFGPALLILGDFFITYSYMSQTTHLLLYGQLLWLLGLLLIMFSGLLIKKSNNYSIKLWFRASDTVKSQLAFWIFITSVSGFLLFFMVAYLLSIVSNATFVGLPLFITMYSIIAVMLSIFLGNFFEAPFQKISQNIRKLMFEDNKQDLDTNFSTSEFRFLQQFILDAYEHKESKDYIKKHLGEITAQVAHDIRSPAAALLVLAQTCKELQEKDRIALRDAAYTIQDIANNVLNQYRVGDQGDIGEQSHDQDILISGLALEVLSEKRLQYKNHSVRFEYHFAPDAYFAFVKGDQTSFKRMLSNLLNNAVEACKTGVGEIAISIEVSLTALVLSVQDNGVGMSDSLVKQILAEGSITAGKQDGHGIGLSQVKQTVAAAKGQIHIESTVEKGTRVDLIFPKLRTPLWIADRMTLAPNAIVIILDDDNSIHTAWDHRLQPMLEKSKEIQVVHFTEGQAVIDYVAQLDASDRKRLFLLSDYELLYQKLNGLDVIEQTKLERSILVTSHYANPEILKRAALLKAKVLPKLLVAELPIYLVEPSSAGAAQAVDVVIVDDKPQFMNIIIGHYLKDKRVKLYEHPAAFLQEYTLYSKDTPICLDDDLGVPGINGRMLAEQLHQEGYKKLYLISGMQFADLPDYLTAIDKNKIADIFAIPKSHQNA